MRGVVKRFGPTVALAGVDLEVERGEVHALLGENGAGKSTLMKVLAGVHAPGAGSIRLEGAPYAPATPEEARRAGVRMVYQELTLAPDLSVEANVLLGIEESRWGLIRRRRHEEKVREALELLGHADIDPRTSAGELSIGAQQVVEIARALVARASLVVLDEPTSSLTLADVENLFRVIRRLRDRGVSVVYISHFLEEVFRIADRFTVLRNGETAGTGTIGEVETRDIIEMMAGKPLAELFPRVPHRRGEPLLELNRLHGRRLPRGVSLTLHRGEILGIAGLIGAGRTETLRAVYGLEPVVSGEVKVAGIPSTRSAPRERARQGIGLLSEDRKEEGLALIRSVADNITLSDMRSVSRWGWISPRRQRALAARWIERVRIRCRDPSQPAGDLSGGNQQKTAIARLLHQQADVLLLDEPTRGIDVASKVEVYRLMGELAAEGKGVLFVSSYIPELLGVSDRIAVMSRGEIAGVRDRDGWDEESVLLAATKGEDGP